MNKYQKVCKEIAEEREHKCTGCGRYDVPLSHSHLIRKSWRKDLEACKENITYHCLSIGDRKGCHEKWEDGGRGLLDYDTNMEIIKRLDKVYYENYCTKT